jgi:hypothetical protein
MANAYQWAKAIMGEINPHNGWGPEDVEGMACTVVVEVVEDAQGEEKNRVVKVRPTKARSSRPSSTPSE